MPRGPRSLPEKLYLSTVSWEGWTFRVLSSTRGLRRIVLRPASTEELAARWHARIVPDDAQNGPVLDQLREYLRGERHHLSIALDIRGTPFQQEVWDDLLRIPYGRTITYSDVAARIGRPTALRAIGQAVGANPVPIVIPCHRVIGADGRLVGFGGGLPLKERLLYLERGSLSL